jgi:anti-sigma B factor antagonist
MEIKTRDHSDVVIFDIDGEIRISEAPGPTLHQLVKTHLEGGKRNILLNLKNVGFIDSFGVGQILSSFISTHDLGGKLKLCHVSKKILLIFDITMLRRVLEVFDDCDSALKSFETP